MISSAEEKWVRLTTKMVEVDNKRRLPVSVPFPMLLGATDRGKKVERGHAYRNL